MYKLADKLQHSFIDFNQPMGLCYLERFMGDGYAMAGKETNQYLTIITLYEQQKYMYDNRGYSVEGWIVSIS